MRYTKTSQNGFMLLEYIVSLVIAAIMAAMVYAYFGEAYIQSTAPVIRLQQTSQLSLVMENIVTDFNRLNAVNLRSPWKATTAYKIGDIVTSGTTGKDYYYKCIAEGTSGSTEPNWAVSITAPGTLLTEGTVTWARSDNTTYNTVAVRVWKANTNYSNNEIIVPSFKYNNGHFYKCTTSGTSNADPNNEPFKAVSARISGQNISDGTAQWTEVGTILNISDTSVNLEYLYGAPNGYLTVTPGRYDSLNKYSVVSAETKYIKFDSANAELDATGTDEKGLLKLTIKSNDSGEVMSRILPIR